MAVVPAKGFVSFGAAGGPFTAVARNFFLTNAGISPLNWSLVNMPSWLGASATNGTLTPGSGGVNVLVGLNAAAYVLTPGTYTADVLFSNQTSHATRDRPFVLMVSQPLVQNGGFEMSTLSYWFQTGPGGPNNGYVNDLADDGSATGLTPHSGTYLAAFGAVGEPGFISQTIPTVAGQSYLLSFWLTNPVAGNSPRNIEQFSVNWNTNATVTNTIFSLSNPPQFGWTNATFIVTATSSNSVLQFGARNDPFFFGLDDVSLIAIPLPSFITAGKANSNFIFTWNSLSNIQYVVQASTNLAQTNWLNMATNTAKGNALSFTNSITNSARFYRIRRLP